MIEGLLLDAARLSVQIRREYGRIKRTPQARYYTYVLQLQDDKMYVGCSDNLFTRLMEHRLLSPSAAVWVREHGPVRRVVEVSRNCAHDDEQYKTLEYMSLFGWENVRGAGWCRSAMRAPPSLLADFERDPGRPFEYMSRRDIDAVVRHVDALATQLSEPDDTREPKEE
jgi:hypothetical protein